MRGNDIKAFVQENTAHLLQLAFLLTCDNEHAEDLVQEVMLGEIRNWEAADTPGQRRSQARRSLVRAHLATRRPRETTTVARCDPELVAFGAAEDTNRVHHRRAAVGAHQLLLRLSTEQRVVLVLRYYENLDDEEISALVDLAPGVVRAMADQACSLMDEQPAPPTGYGSVRGGTAPLVGARAGR